MTALELELPILSLNHQHLNFSPHRSITICRKRSSIPLAILSLQFNSKWRISGFLTLKPALRILLVRRTSLTYNEVNSCCVSIWTYSLALRSHRLLSVIQTWLDSQRVEETYWWKLLFKKENLRWGNCRGHHRLYCDHKEKFLIMWSKSRLDLMCLCII